MESFERYKRQIAIEGWGVEAQEKLKSSQVCVVGVGGLGSPVSLYLAAAGVGTIVLCDYQEVELSNLNRQILYRSDDIGRSKLERAQKRLTELNPEIAVKTVYGRIVDDTAPSAFAGADLIVDCLDSFEARFVLNRYAAAYGVPFVHAGITGLFGQLALLHPPQTPCLQCFIPPGAAAVHEPPPVLGATAGVLGSLQAIVALKVLSGRTDTGYGVFHTIDLTSISIESFALQKNPECPVCGQAKS